MSDRPRHKDGRFMSAVDAMIAQHEAELNAEIKAKMDAGMTFDEAWVALGGQIIPIEWVPAGPTRTLH